MTNDHHENDDDNKHPPQSSFKYRAAPIDNSTKQETLRLLESSSFN
jgi:hypothetical protein